MVLIDVGPTSRAATTGIHAADIPVRRSIFRLRYRAGKSDVLALDRPMCVLCHFHAATLLHVVQYCQQKYSNN